MAQTTLVIERVEAAVTATNAKLVAEAGFFEAGETLHFDHGHVMEITGKLVKKNKSKVKYPLVILVEDIEHDVYAGMLHCDLRLFIVNFNPNQEQYSPQRWEERVKPRLLPIYEELMVQLGKRFSWDKVEHPGNTPPNKFTVRTHFGVWLRELNGTVKNMLSDPLDAIEIEDLKVNVKALSC